MKSLSNESLLETFYKSIRMNLDEDFIRLLRKEIERRNLEVDISIRQAHLTR